MASELIETRHALIQLRSQRAARAGIHLAEKIAVGVPGVPVGHSMYDPNLHPGEAIDPSAAMEWATGLPHVTVRVPFRPEHINLVVHTDPAERLLPSYLQPVRKQKLELAQGLFKALSVTKMPTDKINYVVLGDPVSAEELEAESVYVPESESPEIAAKAVAELCVRGLTFVISDFNKLPLGQNNQIFQRTLAIKTNHKLELELPHTKRKVDLSVGSGRSIKLWKKNEVDKANQSLAIKHRGLRAFLGSLGMEVAQVAHDNHQNVADNVTSADEAIASAVRNIARR
jgi:hypothetical protein